MNELVSIITPSYNSEKYISEMIKSVLLQTYTNWELLITDDCSTDKTVEIIRQYADRDKRIKLFSLKENSGAGIARNNSIKEAKGRFIAFLDSDDIWKPQKLEKQVRFMESNNYKFTFCQSEVIDENGKIIGFIKRKPKVSFKSTRIINYIGTSGAIYDTKEIGKFYMKPIRRRQDWVLWLDILSKTKYSYCLNEVLCCWRTGDSKSLSAKKYKLFKIHQIIYKDYLGYSNIESYLIFYGLSLPCIIIKKVNYIINSKIYLLKKQYHENRR